MLTLILECSVHDIIFVPLEIDTDFDFKLDGTCGLYLARKHSSKKAECSFKKKTFFSLNIVCFTFHFNV